MALIGSAMGNSIIFRTHNSFDRFTEDTLEKLSYGSNKIKYTDISNKEFFGGSLFFSPRDVNKTHKEQLKNEFSEKIINSVKKWRKELKKGNFNYSIFGLFDDYVFAPTPSYFDFYFYKTLRESLINEIVGNILKYRRHPAYETGKQFCSNFKSFLSLVFMNDYDFLSNLRENEIRNYIEENVNKAYQVMGEYEEGQINNQNICVNKFNNLEIYFNKEYLKNLEIDFKSNKKFQVNQTLLINKIFSLNINEGSYNVKEYGIDLNITKIEENYFSFSIEKFNDFGLILKLPEKLKEISENDYNDEKLCSDLFQLWNDICEKINFSEKNIIDSFTIFIDALIKRRNENVKKWIEEMTKNYDTLKNLQEQHSPINDCWRICKIQCRNCFLQCCKLQGHSGSHECPYNHKCKEKCQICIEVNCNEKECSRICDKKAGHEDEHSCGHFHSCSEKCQYFSKTIDCKEKCCLEFNHKDNHRCKLIIHHCKEKCYLNEEANNCDQQCVLPYPHEENHNCNKLHRCKKKCSLEGKRNCKTICIKEYNHKGDCNCEEKHYCIEKCDLYEEANNCGQQCVLEYPHEESHNCNQQHMCKDVCSLKDKSISCNINCSLPYGHSLPHKCNLEDHKCNGKCRINQSCQNRCSLPAGHDNDCLCGKCTCPHPCQFKDYSRNCQGTCILTGGHTDKVHKCQQSSHLCNAPCKYRNISSSGCNIYCKEVLEEKGKQHEEHICGNNSSIH